jgi:carboxyl-terminal processing protease
MRTVYGGGGIMPDCFVPVDTAAYTDYHTALVAKGVVSKCVTRYIESNRQTLNSTYRNFTAFNSRFSLPDDMLLSLREEGEKSGVSFNEEQYARSLPLIKTQLKALMARDLWGTSEYYQVMNASNECLKRALTILQNGDYERVLSIAN